VLCAPLLGAEKEGRWKTGVVNKRMVKNERAALTGGLDPNGPNFQTALQLSHYLIETYIRYYSQQQLGQLVDKAQEQRGLIN
jgi:hypothetical protein